MEPRIDFSAVPGKGFSGDLCGFKRFFVVKFFWPGLRVFGRALDVSVGFRGGWSVFKFSGSELVFSVVF